MKPLAPVISILGFMGAKVVIFVQKCFSFHKKCLYLHQVKYVKTNYKHEKRALFQCIAAGFHGVVMNTDAWYDLFDVKPGNKLYVAPEKRAHIW